MSQPLLTEAPEKAKQRTERREPHPNSARSFQGGSNPILQLQRTLGNQRVAQLIKAKRLTPEGRIIGLQSKLTVGAADDQYEQEADRVARQVVSMPDSVAMASLQQALPAEGEASQTQTLQSKPLPLAASITPFVQRQMGREEEIEEEKDKEEDKDEVLQAKFLNKAAALPLQRQTATEEEKTEPVQAKLSIQRDISPAEEDKDQVLQTKRLATSSPPVVQRQTQSDEESEDNETPLQAKFLTETYSSPMQRQSATEEEEPETIQTKSAGSLADSFEAGDDVESRLSQSKGSGSQLPDAVRTYMEPRFGVDFSHVNVHTGSNAIQMNRNIGAQAFTHGSDIYYGAGSSPTNLELTAHELTHVVQQTGGVPLQTKRPHEASLANADPSLQRACGATGVADDQYGQKAARLASPAVSMNSAAIAPVQQTPLIEGHQTQTLQSKDKPSLAQRKTARYQLHDDHEEEEQKVQPKGVHTHAPQITPSITADLYALNHGGSPLPKSMRAFFEPRFGADFSQVRVHTGSQAVEAAKSINAKAFTVGQNIAFGGGQYAPESKEGRRLLAHELQQNDEQLQRVARNSPVDALLMPRANVTVQRDSLGSSVGTVLLPSPGDPFGLLAPKDDQLRFTNRSFPKLSLPTVCPRCHDKAPIGPQLPQFVDRDATEPRLVTWGKESDLMLHHGGSVRILQLDPNATDTLVDDYGAGLIKRIMSSHEFEGSDAARARGANTIRDHWGNIRPVVRERLSTWYRDQLFEAAAMTPKWASPVLDPMALRTSLASHYGERALLGRWGAEAAPGQKYGVFEIDDIGLGQIWFHLPKRPLWRYRISQSDFVRHDPFVAAVAEQVYDNTKWILQVLPVIMKVGAFAMGFSGNIAVIIAGIVLDELATEMQAETEGRPGRSVEEILGSGATQLIVDRIFHGLLGGGAGRAGTGMGKSAIRIEKIAEKAVPAIRRELVQVEKPLVKQALESGTARQVTDAAMKAEGYVIEVAVEAAGKSHIFRLNRHGTWCRFSSPICGLDLGADVAAAAKSPSSFTNAKLAAVRKLFGTAKDEISFLSKMYERMRAAGKVDMALLSKEERALLDQLAPSGDAAKLSLRELRDLPVKLGLKRDVAVALDQEAKLIQQLYREGRPLYEIMRMASPSSAARSRVLGEAYGRDAVTSIAARSGALHVDHVVPINDIVRMSGFDKLRPDRQLEIVNDVKNLRALDALANSSRGDRSWWNWAQAQIYYDSAQIAKMRALEDELRIYLEGQIRV